ncbi:Protein of unknown function, partial [Cotesia congregata]
STIDVGTIINISPWQEMLSHGDKESRQTCLSYFSPPECAILGKEAILKDLERDREDGNEEETDTIGIFAFPTINLTHLVTNLTEKPKPPHLLTNIAEEPVGENTLLSPWGDSLEGNENRLTRIGLHHQEESKHRYITIANTGAVLSIITSLALFFGYYYYGCCCNCLQPLQKFKTRKQKSFQGKTNETFELTDTISMYPTRPGSPRPAKHQQSLPGVHGQQKITPTPSRTSIRLADYDYN